MKPLILLIEDNASDIELVRTAFEEIGVNAAFSIHRDGDSAIGGLRLTAAESGPIPDLVLLDLNLPRASGHDVLAVMRSLNAFSETPVVVFSTSNHATDRIRCRNAGADDYLVKPPHFDDLLVQIRGLCERWLRRA